MKEEKESGSRPPEMHFVPAIDFFSPEFNRIDDLNDCCGNYRSFQPLDKLATAHERHQMERERRERSGAPVTDEPRDSTENETGSDGAEAGPNASPLHDTNREAPKTRGRFKKSEYISFVRKACFHGRSRVCECRRCLDVCPAGAIRSADREISINRYLCEGCGACALVCPADALQLVQPSQEELLNSLRARLEGRSSDRVPSVYLIISDTKQQWADVSARSRDVAHLQVVHFPVQHIAHVRLELILAALVCGAGAVTVACGRSNPATVRHAVETQVQMARAILRGLGLAEENCRFVVPPLEDGAGKLHDLEAAGPGPGIRRGPMVPPVHLPVHDRRTLIRLATQYLYGQAGAREPALLLPAGSPFGAVAVHRAACTLCMACATACPFGALSAGDGLPGLLFQESRCHQCGLCTGTCPEGAIRLLPRLFCDLGQVEAHKTLHEAQPLRCVECGLPFASHTMMDRIREKLAGHWMYASERQLRRLQMCRTCSARDALASSDMKTWNVR